MTDGHNNIRFNPALHDYSFMLFSEAVADVEGILTMFGKLYPNADGGAADRARRNLVSAVRCFREVQGAMEVLSVEETGSGGPWTTKSAPKATPAPYSQPKDGDVFTAFAFQDPAPWPFPFVFEGGTRHRAKVVITGMDGQQHIPPVFEEISKDTGLLYKVGVKPSTVIGQMAQPLWISIERVRREGP